MLDRKKFVWERAFDIHLHWIHSDNLIANIATHNRPPPSMVICVVVYYVMAYRASVNFFIGFFLTSFTVTFLFVYPSTIINTDEKIGQYNDWCKLYALRASHFKQFVYLHHQSITHYARFTKTKRAHTKRKSLLVPTAMESRWFSCSFLPTHSNSFAWIAQSVAWHD